MAQKNTKKQVKAEPQAQQVTIEDRLNRWEEFFEKNKTNVIVAVLALIVVVVGCYLYKSKVVEPREIRVAEYMYPSENYFMNEQYKLALDGDELGNMGFIEIAGNYGGTKAGKLAKAYAGLCLAQLDSCELAIEYLSKFNGKDQMLAPAVIGALADCYASTGQSEKAAAAFEKAASKADNDLQTPLYLFNAGLVYESMDKPAQALKLYNKIKSDYPASQEAATIEAYITRLTSK